MLLKIFDLAALTTLNSKKQSDLIWKSRTKGMDVSLRDSNCFYDLYSLDNKRRRLEKGEEKENKSWYSLFWYGIRNNKQKASVCYDWGFKHLADSDK